MSFEDQLLKSKNVSPLVTPEKNYMTPPPAPIEKTVLKERRLKTKWELMNSRAVEDVIRRNNIFIVHMLNEFEEFGGHHNDNSLVSKKATYEDDMDILLSLEPSISASSVVPGEKTKVWPGASGFLLGGGEIGEVGGDSGSHGEGIKKRGGKPASIERIDEVVGHNEKSVRKAFEETGEHGMNELVINNPEVFGFFQHAEKDENGKLWAYDLKTKEYAQGLAEEKERRRQKMPGSNTEMLQNIIPSYHKRFVAARERGIPLYVMTGSREFYPCLGVNEDGSIITLGEKIIPEEVATGRAGLVASERKKIGERILPKNLFLKSEAQEEAKKIIEEL